MIQGPVLAAINLADASDDVLRQANLIAAGIRGRLVVCYVLHEGLRVRMTLPHSGEVDARALADVDELCFDRMSQIRMGSAPGSWSRGRVTLVGDAASCVSLLAGQGSALAMTAAYLLAGELHRAQGDYPTAFARYEERFNPFVLAKQNAALRFAGAFAPASKLSIFVRNQIMNLFTVQWIANLTVGRQLADAIELPEY